MTDHVAHQFVHGRKQQLTGVLVMGESLDRTTYKLLGAHHALKGATNHHRDGTALDKALKDLTEPGGLLGKMR